MLAVLGFVTILLVLALIMSKKVSTLVALIFVPAITGFIAARSLRSRAPVLHIDTIEFLEGTNHGIQASNQA